MSILISLNESYAVDLGKYGNIFQITEESFIAMIKRRLSRVDLDAERVKMEKKAKDRANHPIPSKILPATEDREFTFDPTYILTKDIFLPCGKMLHKAGTVVNPLKHMDFNRRIFFIDGRAEEQVEWIKEQLENPEGQEDHNIIEDRIILVGGSVFKLQDELESEHKQKIYFDQDEELITKFMIRATPAIVEQDGLLLKIKEIEL